MGESTVLDNEVVGGDWNINLDGIPGAGTYAVRLSRQHPQYLIVAAATWRVGVITTATELEDLRKQVQVMVVLAEAIPAPATTGGTTAKK